MRAFAWLCVCVGRDVGGSGGGGGGLQTAKQQGTQSPYCLVLGARTKEVCYVEAWRLHPSV